MKKQNFNQNWTVNGRPVTLPRDEMFHTARTADAPAGDAQAFFQAGNYLYTKQIGISSAHAYVNFDGVYKNAKVYLNDELKADVPYGYIPFTVELGEVREEDILKVECDNLDQPDSRWYSGAGIYRDVTLYTADGDHILPNGIKTETLDYEKGLIALHAKTTAGTVKWTILDREDAVAEAEGNDVEVIIPNAKLWDAEHPYLYTVKASLKDDEAEIRLGVRQIEKRSDGIYVNGKKVLLKGGCIHHDNGLLGAATYKKSEARRVRILKEAGFNAIRSAHNPTSEAMLEACDELGMYVMDETWDMWFNHKNKYDYATYWEDHHMEDIRKMVERDYNHPSVILYSIGNEVSEPAVQRGIDDVREMVKLFHELDKTRPVTGGFNLMIITNASKGKGIYKEEGGMNQDTNKMNGMNSTMFNMIVSMVGSGMNKAANGKKADEICSPSLNELDLCGYNYASGRYAIDQKLHPKRLIFGSETMPYDIPKNWKMVEELDNVCGDFMWTAWDYIGENGIGAWAYTKDAAGFSKPYPWWLADTGAFDILGDPNAEADWTRAVWHSTEKPLIDVQPINHDQKVFKAAWRGTNGLPTWSWKGCEGRKAVVEVFADAAKAELYLNGKKVGKKALKDKRAVFKVKYEAGKLEAVAYDRDGRETGRNELVSAKGELKAVLRPEENCVKAGDILYVPVRIEDADGITEVNADRKLKVEVENGELLAFGSANPRTIEDVHTGEYTTYYGKALAIVKAKEAGVMTVRCEDCTIEVKVEE
ncbi:MAG: DUF4982 domain-containing protein [Erysipelotrichaceae bacterium]|nr:DUF4982 domain-containing protein [Erysipelotrichaceae bacterium]